MTNYLKIGGPLMWVLLILSIVSLTIIIGRIIFFIRFERKMSRNFKLKLIQLMTSGERGEALLLCENEKNTVASIIGEFLQRYKMDEDFNYYDQLVKEITLEKIHKLGYGLHVLGIIAYTSPMIGLLGTVTGMISAFDSLGAVGQGDPTVVANGISQALLTTAAGLIIAIPAIMAYNILNTQIEKIENEIDKLTTTLINIIRN